MIKKIMNGTNTEFMSHNGGLKLEKVDENNYSQVTTVPGVAHKIKNISNKKAILAIWTNEIYDSNKPDTYKI